MAEDNTPIVTARRRKATRHMRLRLETVKQLRALGAKKKAAKEKEKSDKVPVTGPNASNEKPNEASASEPTKDKSAVKTRTAKIKKATLAKPPVPKAKFRKRQIHKAWLPTHLFHAKRAHITPPSAPLWGFAIALRPTQKSYRPTHRASHERGAVAWDTSYMAAIGLEGQERSIEVILRALGVKVGAGTGSRAIEAFLYEREAPHVLIAPVTILWCPSAATQLDTHSINEGKRKRKLFLRVHPSAFFQLWERVVCLAKVAKPSVTVEDLRFEIGSIEVTGPGSTEALLGALWPSAVEEEGKENADGSVEKMWTGLAGLTNPSMLPSGATLGFDIQDPRFHHPPRTIKLPKTQEERNMLLQLIAEWPVDKSSAPAELFERTSRLKGSKLPSQKAVNRRRTLAKPGQYPDPVPTDPNIPILLYTSALSAKGAQQQPTWTLLAPWKTIQPIWYSLIYYPLSTGQQPRFGGLQEMRQLAFEAGQPWFPADYPGTKAGWEWEVGERRVRFEEWARRPKGKRVSFEKVDLGSGRKGEIGMGWACDWERLLLGGKIETAEEDAVVGDVENMLENKNTAKKTQAKTKDERLPAPPEKPAKLSHVPSPQALDLLKHASSIPSSAEVEGKLLTVRLTLLTRGVPQTCARIYRLPSTNTNSDLRKAWLKLVPGKKQRHGPNHGLPKQLQPPREANLPPHILQQRCLAQSLLEPARAGEDEYPACPGEEDLVGFVTTGNFNLAEGKGTGIGSLLVSRVLRDGEGMGTAGERSLCVVRNAGMDVGRLARWEVV